MTIIYSSHGLGDTYNISSLCRAFKEKYHPDQLVLIVNSLSHKELALMFPGIDEVIIRDSPPLDNFVNAHPSVNLINPALCVVCDRISDLAMYSMILGLDCNTTKPLLPNISDGSRIEALTLANQQLLEKAVRKTVLLVTKANSWPDIPEGFWSLLETKLIKAGWHVLRNDPDIMPIRCIIPFAELCGWVIGANCGLMQVFVQSQAKCRKTILTQDLPEDHDHTLPILSAYNYRRFRKIDGNKYDIEEYVVGNDWEYITDIVAYGRNASGPSPSPQPLTFFDLECTPGEVLDKLSILYVKVGKLGKAHLLYREIDKLNRIKLQIIERWPEVKIKVEELHDLNLVAWENNEILIDAYSDPSFGRDVNDTVYIDKELRCVVAFGKAHRANQQRVRIKNEIDRICNAGLGEYKSYEV